MQVIVCIVDEEKEGGKRQRTANLTAHSSSQQHGRTHIVHKSFFCPPLFFFCLSFIPSFLYFRLYRLELVQYKKNKTPSSNIIYFLSSPPLLSFTLNHPFSHFQQSLSTPIPSFLHLATFTTFSSSHIIRTFYKVIISLFFL